MTTNAIPAPLMNVMAAALNRATAWKDTAEAQGYPIGALAYAADVVDRLNAEGYVVVTAEAVQALWHENEHVKGRLAWWQREAARLGSNPTADVDELARKNPLCACTNPYVVCAVHP